MAERGRQLITSLLECPVWSAKRVRVLLRAAREVTLCIPLANESGFFIGLNFVVLGLNVNCVSNGCGIYLKPTWSGFKQRSQKEELLVLPNK